MPHESPFGAVRALAQQGVISIIETTLVDNTQGVMSLGQISFDPRIYKPSTEFTLETVMSVSKVIITGSIQLYNLTDGEAVTNGLLQTSSTSPVGLFGGIMSVGSLPGDIKLALKLYEVRLSVTGSDASDILSVGSACIRIS